MYATQTSSNDSRSDFQPIVADEELSKSEFRNAMARLGAAVNVITTDGPAGRTGFTACAVCSVTDDPPRLLVCLNKGASVHQAVVENGVVCVNVLSAGHQEIAALFGGKTPADERFRSGDWTTEVTGAPVLNDAIVSLDCKIVDAVRVGTHDVLICQPLVARIGDTTHGLVYFDRKFHELTA
jgi:flavin reductase